MLTKMNFAGATLVALGTLMISTASAAENVLVPDDMFQLRNVGDPQISPEGDWIAYTVGQPNQKDDKNYTHLWMTRFDGSSTIELTSRAKESESAPRFSPDGRYLAFLSGRSDDKKTDQLWLMDRAGGEAHAVTDVQRRCGRIRLVTRRQARRAHRRGRRQGRAPTTRTKTRRRSRS